MEFGLTSGWSRGRKRSSKVKNRWESSKKVKFQYFPKADKLYLKMKLWTRAFQKKLVLRSEKVIKGQKSRKKDQKDQISIFILILSSFWRMSCKIFYQVRHFKFFFCFFSRFFILNYTLNDLETILLENFTPRASFWRGICVFNSKFNLFGLFRVIVQFIFLKIIPTVMSHHITQRKILVAHWSSAKKGL